ncbi:MAG: 4-(cytidine 5'-diphospho)-2-C-methyl-D-erythritol kinase [Desulfomonile tiedjei]|nr:4-(cytidine 5'-diphospho)-2-C-methyl-D-erythritol kinase [Desulfomonile tiedjei]
MKALRVRSPAKVNLHLKVLGRRPDGYHDIETLFQAIDLEDELIIEAGQGSSVLEVPGHADLETASNLVMRAIGWIESETGRSISVKIRLSKKIPVAGGLGGGSSNAAATLMGLRDLFDLPLSDERLAVGALSIGADVPFFLKGGTAIGEGIGERLTQVAVPSDYSMILVNPGFSVSTALVYGGFSGTLTANAGKGKLRNVLREWPGWESILHNDLQPVAAGLHPEIAAIRKALRDAGLNKALMSGSGPTVFGLGEPEELKQVATRLSATWNCILARPLDRGILVD